MAGVEGTDSPFCSLLSVADETALRSVGGRPLREVMGSAVIASAASGAGTMGAYGASMVPRWSQARDIALARARDQARRCGAELVLGLSFDASPVADGMLEVRVLGSAVSAPAAALQAPDEPPRAPVMTTLSGAAYAALRISGFVPVGVALDARSLFVTAGLGGAALSRFSGTRENRQLSARSAGCGERSVARSPSRGAACSGMGSSACAWNTGPKARRRIRY